MSALIDTTIWSLAFRRESRLLNARQQELVADWHSLVVSGGAFLIGPIQQEILSGIRSETVFNDLARWLGYFDLLDVLPQDYDQAARGFNSLRAAGITATPTDMLICAVAIRCDMPVMTADSDFPRFARHLPVQLR